MPELSRAQDRMALSPTRAPAAPCPTAPGPGCAASAAREWGPGLRDRLAQAGQPIAAHHGPATAVVAAEGASGAVAYSVGQTGMLRIFTLTGSQARAPRARASVHVRDGMWRSLRHLAGA